MLHHVAWDLYRIDAIYGGPWANIMAEVALYLTKEAVSSETEAFRQFCKLQIFGITDCDNIIQLWEHTHTHTQTNYYNPRAHALGVNLSLCLSRSVKVSLATGG